MCSKASRVQKAWGGGFIVVYLRNSTIIIYNLYNYSYSCHSLMRSIPGYCIVSCPFQDYLVDNINSTERRFTRFSRFKTSRMSFTSDPFSAVVYLFWCIFFPKTYFWSHWSSLLNKLDFSVQSRKDILISTFHFIFAI